LINVLKSKGPKTGDDDDDNNNNSEQVGVAVNLWTCIREVLDPNLGRATGYPD
jgi:hypothetical protein